MMRTMRASAKWIFLVVIIAFAGWGIFDVGMNVTGQGTGVSVTDAVARVNGTKIDLQTFYQAVRDAQDQQRQQFGAIPMSLDAQRALEDAVLENLVQDILLQQEFRRRGIRVSDAEVISAARNSPPPEVLSVPEFQTDGQFDLQKYQRYLSSGSDPSFLLALESRYRSEIPRLKLFEQLTADLYVSNAKLWQQYRDQHDSITIRLLEVRPALAVADSEATVTDEEVRRYFRDNGAEFERPAVAYTSYVTVSRQAAASDSAAALARAIALKTEIEDGAEFAAVASRESADSTSRVNGGDLGEGPADRFVPVFREATLALQPGELSDPVLSPFGYHIIRLESRNGEEVHPYHILVPIELTGDHLEEVDALADSLDFYAAEQDDPQAIDDVAEMLGLPVLTASPVTEGSRMFTQGRVVPDAGLWAFEALPGEISAVVESPEAYYVFRLDSLREAGVPTFEEVEPAVRRAAINAKKRERARAIAAEIEEQLRTGQPLMEAAVSRLLNARTLGPMTRINPAPALRSLPKVVGRAFAMGVGQASGVIETDAGFFFVEPSEIHLADSLAFILQLDEQRSRVMELARQERVQQFMLSLRNEADVDDRRRIIERAQKDLEARADQFGPLGPLGF